MFQIDLRSRKSVYDQIVDNFKQLIKGEVLKAGESIPTIQDLSKTLVANPNTVLRAYFELESQGFLETEEGKDWFVAGANKCEESSGINALYGRLHADVKALIESGETRAAIGNILGMDEKMYIQADGLGKRFDQVVALDGLNMNVGKGSIYGLVGTNGSGKTTILKHLAGLYYPESGTIKINGISTYNNEHGLNVAYISEEMYFLPDYTLKMLQKFMSSKHKATWNKERYAQLVELFGLNEDQVLSTFSRGMQKQAGFIVALATMPDVLLLDETIDAMDPIVRRQSFKYIVEDVIDREMTVVVTSHNISELDGICDTVGMLKDGKMVQERSLDDLRANVHKIHIAFPENFLLTNYPYDALEVLHMEEYGSTDVLVVRGKADEISKHLQSFNPLVYDHLPMTLEEIFIYERSVVRHD